MALRNIYNYYYNETGESYIKSGINKSGAFDGIRVGNYR